MKLFKDRFLVACATMACGEAWALPPRCAAALLQSLRSVRPVAAADGTFLYPNIPPVGSPSFRRYLSVLRRLAQGERVLQAAHVSVTDRCGYQCGRCSNVSGPDADPPLTSLERLLGELALAGATSVALTGGEPMLRDDLAQVVHLCAGQLAVTILTSGQELDRGRARELRSAGLVAVHVSLDDFSAERHDRMRGRRGAFDQALRAVEACLAAGLYTAIQAVVEPALLDGHRLEDFVEFCGRAGVHEVVLLEPVPVRTGAPCMPFDRATKERLTALHRRATRDATLPKVTAAAFLEGPEFWGCQAGFSFAYVSTGGEVFPCDLAPISFGNAYERGCEEALGRMTRCFRTPSCECFGIRLREMVGAGRVLPIAWEDAEAVMAGYEPGELPRLVRRVLPRRAAYGSGGGQR